MPPPDFSKEGPLDWEDIIFPRTDPRLVFDYYPQMRSWRAEKFGLTPDDLFDSLPKQFNSITIPLLNPESFCFDVCDVSLTAETREDLYRQLKDRRDQRLKEMHRIWCLATDSKAYLESCRNASDLEISIWRHLSNINHDKSYDAYVAFLAARWGGPTMFMPYEERPAASQAAAAAPAASPSNESRASSPAASPCNESRASPPAASPCNESRESSPALSLPPAPDPRSPSAWYYDLSVETQVCYFDDDPWPFEKKDLQTSKQEGSNQNKAPSSSSGHATPPGNATEPPGSTNAAWHPTSSHKTSDKTMGSSDRVDAPPLAQPSKPRAAARPPPSRVQKPRQKKKPSPIIDARRSSRLRTQCEEVLNTTSQESNTQPTESPTPRDSEAREQPPALSSLNSPPHVQQRDIRNTAPRKSKQPPQAVLKTVRGSRISKTRKKAKPEGPGASPQLLSAAALQSPPSVPAPQLEPVADASSEALRKSHRLKARKDKRKLKEREAAQVHSGHRGSEDGGRARTPLRRHQAVLKGKRAQAP